jgi:hypothetical protein
MGGSVSHVNVMVKRRINSTNWMGGSVSHVNVMVK